MVKFNSTSERLKLLEDIEEHNTFFFHICNFYVDSWIVKTLLKSIDAVNDDKRVLKHIMIDILNLKNGMEDNLLLIQQINLMKEKEGEEQKGLDDDVIHAAQQHIDSINTVYLLGVSWLNDETDLALIFTKGNFRGGDIEESEEETKKIEDVKDFNFLENLEKDPLKMDCDEIKIEMEELKEPRNLLMVGLKKEEEGTNVTTDQSTVIQEKLRDEHFDVARTRKCAECGSDDEIRWLALHPLGHSSHQHTNFGFMRKSRQFKTSSELKLEAIIGIKNKGFPCSQCRYVGEYKKNLKQHKRRAHGQIYPCSHCEYSGTREVLKNHTEVKHLNVKSLCDQCDYEGSRVALFQHKKTKHEGLRYPCDLCDYVANHGSHLKMHKDNKHKGVRLYCDQCESSFCGLSNLKRHQKTVHEGKRYSCNDCDYSASQPGQLKEHTDGVHKGIKFPCDQCNYVAKMAHNLRKHKNIRHTK